MERKRTTMKKENDTCVFFTYSPSSIYNLSVIVSLYTLKDNNHLQASVWRFSSARRQQNSNVKSQFQLPTSLLVSVTADVVYVWLIISFNGFIIKVKNEITHWFYCSCVNGVWYSAALLILVQFMSDYLSMKIKYELKQLEFILICKQKYWKLSCFCNVGINTHNHWHK